MTIITFSVHALPVRARNDSPNQGSSTVRFIFSFSNSRGVARIFQKGVTEATPPPLSLVYQRAQSYYRGMKAHIN